jgi:8-oxo-dGTP pyrophosphatase MutT (NUDIX family)
MKKVVSAGGVVLRKTNNKIEILLVYSPPHKAWVLPKGHIDKGETIEEAAIREVKEETGLEDFEIVSKLGIVTRPSKETSGEIVEKDIHIFIFKTNSRITPAPNHEYKKAKWFGLTEGIEKIHFKPEREFLIKHKKDLEKV